MGVADPGAVVLQPAVHVVRPVHVHTHVVELRDRQVLRLPPFVGAVVGIPDAAIVAGDDVVGVARIDPHIMEIAMRAAGDVAKAAASIRAHNQSAPGL